MSVTVKARVYCGMGRWQPDARGRLEKAALELYAERGYDNVTVAEIAERAGLTERTFFRYFADKREVLFSGSGGLSEAVAARVAQAADSLPPIEVAVEALAEAAVFLQERREYARRRQAVIATSPELRERELIKLAAMASTLAGALSGRGVAESTARLAAEAAVAAFKTAFARWAAEGGGESLPDLVRTSARELTAVVTEGNRARP